MVYFNAWLQMVPILMINCWSLEFHCHLLGYSSGYFNCSMQRGESLPFSSHLKLLFFSFICLSLWNLNGDTLEGIWMTLMVIVRRGRWRRSLRLMIMVSVVVRIRVDRHYNICSTAVWFGWSGWCVTASSRTTARSWKNERDVGEKWLEYFTDCLQIETK